VFVLAFLHSLSGNYQMICPYDFLTEFDSWFAWWKCIHLNGLSDLQATVNVQFANRGWKLNDEFKYSGWILC